MEVFKAIRTARPTKLLVIADGPRPNRPGEAEKCAATRMIVDEVDWDCEVHKNFSEINMGPRLRISSGITWAFEIVDKAIILEHDCMPNLSFFHYCAELLDRYERDERVMMINGQNRLFGHTATADSYYFSRYPHIWGWATWRRAWAQYDLDMTYWPEIRDKRLFDQYFRKRIDRYLWESIFQHTYEGKIGTWDYQWFYSIWANSGICATPARNLVQNIGFHPDALHTKSSIFSSLGIDELDLPLIHPTTLLVSSDIDQLEARLADARHKGLTGLLYALNKQISVLKMLVKRATGRGQWPDPGLLVRNA
ncbi:methyltransferase type 11 [Mycobacterium vulneris]|uniref:Methyltransferase type 11 n=2 Tax=Mycolicibacterium vulneris TaxID=547163 RepID=A0A1X2L7C1_9MYCO|nr:methyltransferase type 11 [Mycolicibacterium vulneris]